VGEIGDPPPFGPGLLVPLLLPPPRKRPLLKKATRSATRGPKFLVFLMELGELGDAGFIFMSSITREEGVSDMKSR
jgi:hypothetical protein